MIDDVGGCMNTFTHVPPGFRFHPTDEELVGYYLRRKVTSRTIDLGVIKEIDLYKIEPWDLQEKCRRGIEEEDDWYFFSHKDKKYPTGTRTNRATAAGFWKATGRDKAIYFKNSLIGMRKTLVYYRGRAPNGQKSYWIMHEYRLETTENDTQQEEGWVVCRVFRKKMPTTTPGNQLDYSYSRYMIQQQLDISDRSAIPHTDHHADIHNPMAVAYPCKQEVEEYYNQLRYHLPLPDSSQQLPQLESPKFQSHISLYGANTMELNLASHLNASSSLHCQEQQLQQSNLGQLDQSMNCVFSSVKCTDRQDWKVLNTVVDAQLSHDLEYVSKEDCEYYPAANSYQIMDQMGDHMVHCEKTQATAADYASSCTSSCQISNFGSETHHHF